VTTAHIADSRAKAATRARTGIDADSGSWIVGLLSSPRATGKVSH
jgi:hypothetical protein